eukprot:2167973-Amphidinium_carterae.1
MDTSCEAQATNYFSSRETKDDNQYHTEQKKNKEFKSIGIHQNTRKLNKMWLHPAYKRLLSLASGMCHAPRGFVAWRTSSCHT